MKTFWRYKAVYRRSNMNAAILAMCSFLALPRPSCSNSDNFALLSSTLKTMQQATCDEDPVSLSCPRGTAISIQVAQYGKAAADGACVADNTPFEEEGEEQCLWPNSMQYSLLQTVVEACQKRPNCTFSTKPKSGMDPCPYARKFVEVAYRCRPNEFRSLTACEDDVIRLSCKPYSRVAIFNAQYGRTPYETIHCPQPQGMTNESCTAPYAAETVMQLCHGKRRCEVAANSRTFGTPCKAKSRAYLKVIYACVTLGVLTERYESSGEKDEVIDGSKERDRSDDGFDNSGNAGEKWGDTNSILQVAEPALPRSETKIPSTYTAPPENNNLKTSIFETATNSDESKPRSHLLIYVGIGVLIFVILVVILIGVRCYIHKTSSRLSKTGDMFSTGTPNVFNDAVSDIDNDIDVSHISGTFYDPVHPDMILYRETPGNKGIRAMRPLSTIYPCTAANMYGNVDFVQPKEEIRPKEDGDKRKEVLSPKSLGRLSNSQFYYD